MNLAQLVLEALESLTSNKLRSALTMLGIIIGVGAVVAMMSIGSGARTAITEQIESIGVNLLYIVSGGEAEHPQPLTLEDALALDDPQLAPHVINVAPVLQDQAEISIPGEYTSASLIAVTPDFFEVQSAEVAEGQRITQAHLDGYQAVILLGVEVADMLFNTRTNLLGQKVRLGGQIFEVVGVLEEAGGTGFQNDDNRVLVPLTTAQQRLLSRPYPGQVDMIYVQASSTETVEATIDDVTQILRARHTRSLGEDDFDILNTQAFLETATEVAATMTLFLGGIAGISLLVGGIGIMNIMLVAVSERTREIGLRKALGARKNDIRIQFLVEAAILAMGGGFIGIALGWGIAQLVGSLAAASGNTLNPQVELNAVLLATLFSTAVGLFFGIYPANRAAGLQPVEALRME